jgi:Fic/DOC family
MLNKFSIEKLKLKSKFATDFNLITHILMMIPSNEEIERVTYFSTFANANRLFVLSIFLDYNMRYNILYIPIPPLSVEVYRLLKEFFRWYDKNRSNKIHPIELAALMHIKVVTIHPFADGNGRISRLMMNFLLHKRRISKLSIK